MLRELEPFVEAYPFVGHVGGRGLFLSVELVRDKATKEPLSKGTTNRIFDECVRRGLLTMAYSPHFRLQPALTLDLETARNGIAVLREVFDFISEKRLWDRA
jgi:4-aminobutyrate aminotransferase-like enzyme